MSVNVFIFNMPEAKKANIKVSVFDAFRSKQKDSKSRTRGPSPRPRASTPKSEPISAAETAVSPEATPTKKSKDGTWSQEDDEKLLQLKDHDGNTWKEISQKMKKYSHKELKKHYHLLKKQPREDQTQADGAVSKVGGDFVEVMPEHEDGEEDLDVNIDPGPDFDLSTESCVAVFDEDEWTDEETTLLEKLNKIYDTNKWLHLASQFYDRTGIRVNPAAVRQKLGG